jgi:predicted nicotinamide N-methyase
MLVTLDLDESTEDEVVAVYEVAGHLIRIKSKPAVARGAGEQEEQGEQRAAGGSGGNEDGGGADAAAGPAAAAEQPSSALAPPPPPPPPPTQAKYLNVGLVLWQAGLVAADWIIRHRLLTPPPRKLSVVELGAGVGQCGIALAKAGAGPVVMTDLPHIVPLAQENVRLNFGAPSTAPAPPVVVVVPYTWGEDAAAAVLDALRSGGDNGNNNRWPDLVVAADCLYEPSVYPLLLSAIERVAGPQTRVVLCHRLRVYDERGFEKAAGEGGWEVRAAPNEELHPEYACGGWRLVEMTRRGGGGGED